MRKIAIMTSGGGGCAGRLVSLFNEGNRLRVETVITDRENAGLMELFADSDVETLFIPEDKWTESPAEIMAVLSSRNIELIALDGFGRELPEEIEKEYKGRTVALSTPEEAPREVVAAFARIDDAVTSQAAADVSEIPDAPKSVDEEWAETLKMHYDSSKLRTTPPPVPGTESSVESPMDPPLIPASSGDAPRQTSQFASAQRPAPGNQPYGNGFRQPEREPMPSTYLVWAIVMTVFCCTIPGIVAIVFSSQVSTRYAVGDIEGARRSSRNAEIWIIVSFVLGVISSVLYLPMMLIS